MRCLALSWCVQNAIDHTDRDVIHLGNGATSSLGNVWAGGISGRPEGSGICGVGEFSDGLFQCVHPLLRKRLLTCYRAEIRECRRPGECQRKIHEIGEKHEHYRVCWEEDGPLSEWRDKHNVRTEING